MLDFGLFYFPFARLPIGDKDGKQEAGKHSPLENNRNLKKNLCFFP